MHTHGVSTLTDKSVIMILTIGLLEIHKAPIYTVVVESAEQFTVGNNDRLFMAPQSPERLQRRKD